MDNRLRYLPYGIVAFALLLLLAAGPRIYFGIRDAQMRRMVCSKPPEIRVVPACTACQREFDAGLPRGTRVYAYDEYAVDDGGKVTNVPSTVVFTWDDCGSTIRAVDSTTGYRRTFSAHARISKRYDFLETALRPGEKMPKDLASAVRLHQAYLRRQM